MNILTNDQYRVLTFIDGCNGSGYNPSNEEVELWLKEPEPQSDFRSIFGGFATDGLFGLLASGRSDALSHMVSLRWITNGSRLKVTALGRALLGAANRAIKVDGEASIVILDSKDPLSYARLIGYLTRAKEGLLVDPYFRVGDLMTILNSTSIARILISKQHKGSGEDRTALAVALDSPSLPRNVEIRATGDSSLHDRFIVGEDGEVWTLGASLSSVATSSTVIVPVPQAGAEALRRQSEDWWDQAEQVRTAPKATGEPEA